MFFNATKIQKNLYVTPKTQKKDTIQIPAVFFNPVRVNQYVKERVF